ncbi:zinc-dependent metalloprotease [Bacteroidia bacterium]|nr:zinc-dependent metalloprotease [Bacteroidia bacterium]
MKRVLGLIICLLCSPLFSQTGVNTFEYCGHDSLATEAKRNHPVEYERWEKEYKKMAAKARVQRRGFVSDTTFTLRVVFHVLYSSNIENLSEVLIQSQVKALNEAFGHYHEDTADVRAIFKDRAGDVGIRFQLATVDPNGNSTNGINRRATSVTSFGRNRTDVKFTRDGGVDAWDPTRYFNIWICDLSTGGFDNLLGFATPPSTHSFWTGTGSGAYPLNEQGAVLHYKVVGVNNPLANQVGSRPLKGRVAVHEVGHYLGLRHIWGDGTNATGCSVDDFIEDTPNQRRSSNFVCQKTNNTCFTANDELDLVENYMDYSGDECMVMFTTQQKSIMREAITKYRPNVVAKTDIVDQYIRDDFTTAFKVYYNQNGDLSIDVSDDKRSAYSFILYDLAGQKISDATPLLQTRQEVNFGSHADGLYILQIIDNSTNELLLTQKVQHFN